MDNFISLITICFRPIRSVFQSYDGIMRSTRNIYAIEQTTSTSITQVRKRVNKWMQ